MTNISGGDVKGPLFIVFEGIDGSGKSSLARMAAESLERLGANVEFLAEPTRGPKGLRVREFLSSPIPPDPDVLMELFVEDREEDVRMNIRPALDSDKIVVMDRYYHSNAAYQGASGLSYRRILKVNRERGFPAPDRVYLLDCEPSLSMERIGFRNKETGTVPDSFERAGFLAQVRSLYLEMKDDSFRVLSASRDLAENLDIVLGDLKVSFFGADKA
jgi:dTMP kinase